jgi:uncharacterized membrane protein YfcA
MQIYLPIAEIPVNIIMILSLGLLTGILAGIFGIGGGFLATPLLMFIGISPAIAVSTSANQITASSVSGLLTHLKRGGGDIKTGLFLLIGGVAGSFLGVWIFGILQKIGQIDLVVSLVYVIFLGTIGSLMLFDSSKVILQKKFNVVFKKKDQKISILGKLIKKIAKLPFKVHFPKSDISTSLLVPLILGAVVGTLVSLMGIGGGFIMIPAMVYILRMPSNVIVGTSLFQIVFIAGNVTFLQAYSNHNVDVVLAFLMIISSVIGAQIGSRVGYKIDANSLRSLLSIMILAVCVKMVGNLFVDPVSLYNIELLK